MIKKGMNALFASLHPVGLQRKSGAMEKEGNNAPGEKSEC